jgi:translation elongation factor EF-1alpha
MSSMTISFVRLLVIFYNNIHFTAHMTISNHPGKIHAGHQSVFDRQKSDIACKFDELIQPTDSHDKRP